jgi:hypothetical protein
MLIVNRRLAGQLSAREISQSPEERCDGPAPVEARERSLTASPPFPVALAVWLLSFLHLQPGLTRQPVRFEALVVFLEFRLGLAVRYRLPQRQRIESFSIGFVRNLLLGGPFWSDHFIFTFSPSLN